MLKSKGVKILLFIFLIWLVITIYFYLQHLVIIKRQVIDKTVELGNASVVLKEIMLTDVERNYFFGGWRYDLAAKLPEPFLMPYMRLCDFYSDPYQKIPYGANKIELRGKVVFNEGIGLEESLWDYYDIDFVYKDGVHYGSGRTTINEGEGTIYFAVRDDYYQRNLTEFDIVIRKKASGDSKTIPVAINWRTEKYNFFNKPLLNLVPDALDY